MIDWLTMELPITHPPIPSGSVVKLSPEGEIEWTSPTRVQCVGSYESSVCIRSRGVLDPATGDCSVLEISGNPSKFLQGHNIFGSDDFLKLTYAFVCRVVQLANIKANRFDLQRVKQGAFTVSRVDLTYSYSLDTRHDVRQFIRALDHKANTRRGKGALRGNTLYFGINSRRFTIKFYCKGDELEKHPLHEDLQHADRLIDHADKLLRCELTLRSLELKDLNLRTGAHWNKSTAFLIWSQYMRRINMNAQMVLPDHMSLNLRPSLAATYHRWKDGVDVRTFMSHNTFYTHRRKLLNYGIDIAITPDESSSTKNVVPLIRILEAKPVVVPSWARQLKLVSL